MFGDSEITSSVDRRDVTHCASSLSMVSRRQVRRPVVASSLCANGEWGDEVDKASRAKMCWPAAQPAGARFRHAKAPAAPSQSSPSQRHYSPSLAQHVDPSSISRVTLLTRNLIAAGV